MEFNYKNLIRGDRIIWTIILSLSMLSLLIVYSATGALAFRQQEGNTFYFLVRQMFFLIIGLGIMVVMIKVVPVKAYAVLSKVLVLISIGLLGLAFGLKLLHLPGVSSSGRTLYLGPISFQPAEFAKLALIMYTAKLLGVDQETEEGRIHAFWRILFPTGIICGLILFSNFSTAALLGVTIMCMMFVGRVPLRYMGIVVAAGILLLIGFYFLGKKVENLPGRFGTIAARIERFVQGDKESEKGITQADYAKLAIYEGGWIGKGPGNSDVANYMAAAYNDFIFAIIIEEYGIFGGITLIMLYLIFFFRGILIVKKANRTFPAFLVAGLVMIFMFQAMINMGVSSGVFPVTGQPLPWVSLGGTSLIFTSIAFGCILSVSYQNQKESKNAVEPAVQVVVPDEDQELNG
jgi:cell division protein FtsW